MKKTDKILVTGASGFIGSHLLRLLWQKGYRNLRATSFSRNLRMDFDGCEQIEHIVGDLQDATFCNNISKDIDIKKLEEHENPKKYNLTDYLKNIVPDCEIIVTDGLTEGAACTVLLAKDLINSENPILMANSDQFLEWNSTGFMYKMQEQKLDGGIVTFTATHPKWSFAKTDEYGYVTQVAEKNPISNIATAGVYYWAKGSDYVKYAERMIQKDIRVNGEFYVCPVFNQAIEDGKKVKTFDIQKMWGLGTPEDLQNYTRNFGYGK